MHTRPRSTAILVGTFLLSATLLQAGELRYNLSLAITDLKLEEKDSYTMASFEGARYDAPVGYPLVPILVKNYLIPDGAKAKTVRLEVLETETVTIENPLYPSQPARPIGTGGMGFAAPIEEVYASSEPLPGFEARVLYEGLLESEMIATIAIQPIRYTPAEGKLEVAEKMVLIIEYEASSRIHPGLITKSQNDKLVASLQSLVENPEVMVTLSTFEPLAGQNYRHAIVTPSSFRSTFQPLADWNTARGVKDTIVSLESIASSFQGNDLAEQIRNFVIFAHDQWGLEYLLLGGDEGVVPTRDCFVAEYGGGFLDTIPTDMYFGCLDGNWNSNGNKIYGEMNDGVDLRAEVSVGRASVGTVEEAALFVGKVKVYQENPSSGFASELLLPSEILWEPPDPYYPGDATNDAIAALAHPGTKIAKLYETQGTLSRKAVEDSLNDGVGLVHHMAHGNQTAISCADAGFNTVQAKALGNSGKMPVYVSIACLVGAFDYTVDCLVEGFQKAEHGGTVAWVGNSRYGWGTPPQAGPSESIDISFFGEVYGKDNPVIGPALCTAKEANLGWANYDFGRWSIYELNIHGDPAMPVHSREPSEFVVTYPEAVEGSQTFNVTVASQAGYPVEGMLVCLTQQSSVYAWGTTNSSGVANISVDLIQGSMNIMVTGANHRAWKKDGISVGAKKPELTVGPDTNWIDAETDPLSSYIYVSNTGTDTLKINQVSPYQTTWIDSIYPTNFKLAVLEYRPIEFFVDTTGLEDDIYLGEILILNNDPKKSSFYQPVKLIKGDWPDIDINPDTLVFNIPADDPLTMSVNVTNVGRAGLEVSSATTTTSWIKAINPSSFDLDVGGGIPVAITVDTTGLNFGTYEGNVTLATNDPDEGQRKLPVRLQMGSPDIALSPDTLKFFYSWEEVSKNKTEADMTVKNEGERTLEVSNLIPSKAWISVSEPTTFDVEPDSYSSVHVTVYAENLKQGVYNAYITVSSNDPDEGSVREPVRVLVEETPACISCSPDTAIMDKETMRGFFWVHNVGMLDLNVTKIYTQTPWIYAFFPQAFTVRGLDSAQVIMAGDASKLTSGSSVGTVFVESNDTKNPCWEQLVKLGNASGIAEALPRVFELSDVAPNPISTDCMIRFAVPHEAYVSLAVYDVCGKKVRTFKEGITQPGNYLMIWQSEDDREQKLPQGVYILRMDTPEYRKTQKLIVLH